VVHDPATAAGAASDRRRGRRDRRRRGAGRRRSDPGGRPIGRRRPASDVEVVDLGDSTVLPGLIDVHNHVTFRVSDTGIGHLPGRNHPGSAGKSPAVDRHDDHGSVRAQPGRSRHAPVHSGPREPHAGRTAAPRARTAAATGTDGGGPGCPDLSLTLDIALFHQLGMTPMQAMVAATGQAAACLGLSDRGVLRAGQRADLIAVPGNPLLYLDVLRAPTLVIIGGRICAPRRSTSLTFSFW